MTAPDLGPCVCQLLDEDYGDQVITPHEHSDFPPHACTDCPCEGHRSIGTEIAENQAQINADGSGAPPAGRRTALAIPASLDFATERVQDARAWLDSILANSERFGSHEDALAVCGLADIIEQSGPAFDPIDALALAILRLAARPQRMTARQALEHMRRKVR